MRQAGTIADQLLLLEHPPVITLGRGGDKGNLLAAPDVLRSSGVRFFESERGGDITYHGPGQLVAYPILDLRPDRCDVHRYVRDLEEVMIRAASDFGLTAHRVEGLTGAWVGADKLGAIGVRISRWITSHGFAFNVMTDLDYFTLIVPCGISSGGVTSVSRAAGRPVGMAEATAAIVARFCEVFRRQVIGDADAAAAVSGTHAESAAK
jgi:lipoyl(octanoyl) transferase